MRAEVFSDLTCGTYTLQFDVVAGQPIPARLDLRHQALAQLLLLLQLGHAATLLANNQHAVLAMGEIVADGRKSSARYTVGGDAFGCIPRISSSSV